MKILRRSFLRGAALLAGGAGFTLSRRAYGEVGFGPLVADPDEILDLPEGFSYTILQTAGDAMSDGLFAPGSPDGMACFASADGSWVLMRNHELDLGPSARPDLAFDVNARGGVSRLVLDPETLRVTSSNLVLTGTLKNCAGGPSEWGWLSCEESDLPGHGYVFLCSPDATEVQPPQRILSFGRFKHEAAAVDPRTNIVYLTEDTSDGAFYRHVPADRDQPFVGQLQAMAIVGADFFDTQKQMVVGDALEVRWVDIADPDAVEIPTAVQAYEAGAALVVRGEGCWYADGSVFFSATEGGASAQGQVFRLDIDGDGGTLTLVAAGEGEGELRNPDNLTVSPWGDVIVCEDNDGPNHLRGVTADGLVYELARNVLLGGRSEFCGVCFSPDGEVLFVNLQEPGYTLAIRGPFPRTRAGC